MSSVIFVMILFFIYYLYSPVGSPKVVFLPKGSVSASITHLQNSGIKLNKIDGYILRYYGFPQYGLLDLGEENLSRIEFLKRLAKAKAITTNITLIPGETTEIFLSQLAHELDLDIDKLRSAYEEHAIYKEGSFVADTYNVMLGIGEEATVKYLLDISKKTMNRWAESYNIDMNSKKWLQIVTKASVIQKEASSVSDMYFVSSVIDNRLSIGMKLQMDGSLNYGKYSHTKVTAARIRSDNSVYNTYKIAGLPPYPLCNISKDAIDAAINPKKTDYLFFVRGKNGEHIYSRYFSTHRKNIVNATK